MIFRIHALFRLGLTAAVLLLAGSLLPDARAQTTRQDGLPPAIVIFSADLPGITVSAAETGQTAVTLAWRIANFTPGQRITLEIRHLNGWIPAGEDGDPLLPTDSRVLNVSHPLTFAPPAFRLSALDAQGRLLDERLLEIPYISACQALELAEATPEPDAPPCDLPASIESFTSGSSVDANALAQRTAVVSLAWQVAHRSATSHLVFEQILPNGSAVPVELPRPTLWVSSAGQGAVAPVLPQNGTSVVIRLRLVDLADDTILDEAQVEIPIVGTVSAAPTAAAPTAAPPTAPPASGGQAQIVSFTGTPNPADPRGRVTLRWEVRGASSVTIEWFSRQGDTIRYANLPLSGSMDASPADVAINGAEMRFSLFAMDANNQPVTRTDGTWVAADLVVQLTTSMRIVSFTASPDPAGRGGTLTLSWNVQDAVEVYITRVTPEGIFTMDAALDGPHPPSGSLAFRIPADYTTSITFYLGATDANGVSISAPLTVGITCPYSSFMAPVCPLTQQNTQAAFQTFENGYMVWRGDLRRIYVLYLDGSYESYDDTWTQGEPVNIGEAPPAGLIAPQRGFGKVWATWPSVRARLGWATGDETSYNTPVETVREAFGRYPATGVYFHLPGGEVVHLVGYMMAWEFQQPR